MRTIPAELVKRYEDAGLVDAGHPRRPARPRAARPAPTPASACTPPCGRAPAPSATSSSWRGGSPPDCARAASDPATSSRCSCPTGWRPPRRSGRRRSSAPWSCRSCTSTAARSSRHILGDGQATRVRHRRTVRAHDVPPRSVRGRPDRRLVGGGAQRPRADFDDLLEPTSRCRAPSPPIRPRPALIAFTSGTTRDPKGVVHSHQTLGFETRQLLANYPPDRGRQLTATPVGHFIGMLSAFLIPVLEGAPIDLCRRLGPRRGAGADEVGRADHRRRAAVLRHQPARPSRLHRRTPASTSRPSASAGRRCPPRSPRRLADSACSCSAPTAAPSIRRSPAPAHGAPEDKRLYTDGNARPGVEIRLGRRRRDPQPRARPVPRLHRSRS